MIWLPKTKKGSEIQEESFVSINFLFFFFSCLVALTFVLATVKRSGFKSWFSRQSIQIWSKIKLLYFIVTLPHLSKCVYWHACVCLLCCNIPKCNLPVTTVTRIRLTKVICHCCQHGTCVCACARMCIVDAGEGANTLGSQVCAILIVHVMSF